MFSCVLRFFTLAYRRSWPRFLSQSRCRPDPFASDSSHGPAYRRNGASRRPSQWRYPCLELFAQPADIVTQILNFGTPAPIDVQVTGMNQRGNYLIGERLANQFRHIPGAVDVHVQQAFDNPTLFMEIDRARAQSIG